MFDGELSFALKLARDGATRLACHACRDVIHGVCRLAPLLQYPFFFMMFCWICTFPGLTYTVLSLFSDPDMHPLDFSLLNRREADEEPEDDVLMQKAAGLAGGVRFGPDGNEVIPASPDVADMTEDDVMLMTVSKGSQEESGMAEPVGDLVVDLSLDAARFDEQMARVASFFRYGK